MFGIFFAILVLVLGIMTLGAGISHAVRPRERKLATLRPLSVATVFACVSATFAGLGATFKHTADAPSATSVEALLQSTAAGLAEAMVPALVGFSLLAVAWLLATIGLRKQV
jgi:hypothetical protein